MSVESVPVSKQQRVYEMMRTRILGGTYGPGHRLVLDALAREFEVSQVPVREAIRRLEAEGWVEYTRNVGASVKQLDADAIEQTLHTLALLEGYATALAARKMSRADIARARDLNRQMRAMLGSMDPIEFSSLNRRFHFAIVDCCPNDHLNQLVLQEWDRLDAMRRSLFVYLPQRGVASVEEHDAILALIKSRADPVEIELAAREHKLHLVNQLRALRKADAGKEAATA